MLVGCWAVKGGVGTSVVTAALAVIAAQRGDDTLVVDLAGDQAALFGVDASGPGLSEWLAAGADVAVDALNRLEVRVAPDLALLTSGRGVELRSDAERLPVALGLTDRPGRSVFVDLGVLATDDARARVLDLVGSSVFVTRACYLALSRVRSWGLEANTTVVLIDEPGRALGGRDVAHALGVAEVRRVPWEPSVARAVDAGTLATRLPTALRRLGKLL